MFSPSKEGETQILAPMDTPEVFKSPQNSIFSSIGDTDALQCFEDKEAPDHTPSLHVGEDSEVAQEIRNPPKVPAPLYSGSRTLARNTEGLRMEDLLPAAEQETTESTPGDTSEEVGSKIVDSESGKNDGGVS